MSPLRRALHHFVALSTPFLHAPTPTANICFWMIPSIMTILMPGWRSCKQETEREKKSLLQDAYVSQPRLIQESFKTRQNPFPRITHTNRTIYQSRTRSKRLGIKKLYSKHGYYDCTCMFVVRKSKALGYICRTGLWINPESAPRTV